MADRTDEQAPPFDERAALDELERLLREIERHKSRRTALDEEFERFTRSFKTPGGLSSLNEDPIAREVVLDQRGPAIEEARGTPPAADREAERINLVVESTALPTPAAAPPPERSSQQATRAGRTAMLAGALVVLAASLLATWTWMQRDPESSSAPSPGAASPAIPSETPGPPAAARVTASPFESELATSRAVWVRVLADGERVIERELPANARVPVKAKKTIVIRAGDAGAVRLSIGGRDQGVLGPDGEVATRTFSVPPQEKR
jgi:cytoskeleton protein RodZ